MSTYLVAFVIGDFICKSDLASVGDENETLIRVCAKRSSHNQLNFALSTAKRIIEVFEQIYDVKFPLPKCGKYALL